ncbi:MAG: RNA 2',3'-cyclic phosphodiesterase [Candidatus Doudnabacteria bacterium]|nr:RNA 2',3'-cyclic phosphodiesterase [Candidatus Doudnabacteria bacterium]
MGKRIFLALDVPKTAVVRLKKFYDYRLPVTWTKPENLHVTLLFLGELDELQEAQAHVLCEQVCFRHPPVDIEYDQVEAKKYMIWAAVKPNPPLMALQDDLQRTFAEDESFLDTNFDQSFRPHTNLARAKQAIAKEIFPARHMSNIAYRATHVVVFESILRPDYPRYLSQDAFELKGIAT